MLVIKIEIVVHGTLSFLELLIIFQKSRSDRKDRIFSNFFIIITFIIIIIFNEVQNSIIPDASWEVSLLASVRNTKGKTLFIFSGSKKEACQKIKTHDVIAFQAFQNL